MNGTNEPEAWAKARQSLAQVSGPTMAYPYVVNTQSSGYSNSYVPAG